MDRYEIYTVSEMEAREIQGCCNNQLFVDIDRADQEHLAEAATRVAAESTMTLPALSSTIGRLRESQGTVGLLALQNLPKVSDPRRLIAFIGGLLGNISRYENEGDFIIPIKEKVTIPGERPSFQNAQEFSLHTDLSYASNPPDFLAMHSIVNNSSQGGYSVFCDVEEAINYLTKESTEELQKPIYLFPTPSHYQGGSIRSTPILTRDRVGGMWNIRFRRDGLRSLSRSGISAVADLLKAFSQASFEATLAPDTLVIVNNKAFLHGRTAFLSAEHANEARYLNRIYINLDVDGSQWE